MNAKEMIEVLKKIPGDTELQMPDGFPIVLTKYLSDKRVLYISDEDGEEGKEKCVTSDDIFTHNIFKSSINIENLDKVDKERLKDVMERATFFIWNDGGDPLDDEDGKWAYLLFDNPQWTLSTDKGENSIVLRDLEDFLEEAEDYIKMKKKGIK